MNMQAEAFLTRYRDDVLKMARLPGAELLGNRKAAELIRRIQADEQVIDVMPPRRDMLPGEDAFWFCVMQMEEFVEMTWPGAAQEPFVQFLMKDLQRAVESLEHGRDLPMGMMVHWMDLDEPLDELRTGDEYDWDRVDTAQDAPARLPERRLIDRAVAEEGRRKDVH